MTEAAPRAGRRDLTALIGALALSLLVVAGHIREYRAISPIDELQHIDAVAKFPHVIRRGELVGQEAMREEACRGFDGTFVPPPCNLPGDLAPADFQEEGYNTAYIHSPVFYGATNLVSRATEQLPGVDGIVGAARLTDAVWLALGLALTWLVLVHHRVEALGQFGLLTLLGTAPLVLHASATVNPDALALGAGATMLLALDRWERSLAAGSGKVPPLVRALPALAAAACVSFKFTHVAGVALVLVYLALSATADPTTRRPRLYLIGSVVVAVLVTQLAWSTLQNQLALVPREAIPMVARNQEESFKFAWIGRELHTMLTPLRDPYLPALLRGEALDLTTPAVDLVALAGVVSAIVLGRPRSRERVFALAAVAAMILAGPMMVTSLYLSSKVGSVVASRYGLSLLPGIALCAAPALRFTRVRRAVAVFALIVAAATLNVVY